MKTWGGSGRQRVKERFSQKPTLLSSWSWVSSLQSREKYICGPAASQPVEFCCGNPQPLVQTAQGRTCSLRSQECPRPGSSEPVSLQSLGGHECLWVRAEGWMLWHLHLVLVTSWWSDLQSCRWESLRISQWGIMPAFTREGQMRQVPGKMPGSLPGAPWQEKCCGSRSGSGSWGLLRIPEAKVC